MGKNSESTEMNPLEVAAGTTLFLLEMPNGDKRIISAAGDGVTDAVHVVELPHPSNMAKIIMDGDACDCKLLSISHLHMVFSRSDILQHGKDKQDSAFVQAIREIQRRSVLKNSGRAAGGPPLTAETPLSVAFDGLIETLEKAGRDAKAAK